MVTVTYSPSSVLIFSPSLKSVLKTFPDATWYSSTSVRAVLLLSKYFSSAAGSAAKASLVGANTVKGPLPAKVSTRPAACKAVTNVDKSEVFSAIPGMVFGPMAVVVVVVSSPPPPPHPCKNVLKPQRATTRVIMAGCDNILEYFDSDKLAVEDGV